MVNRLSFNFSGPGCSSLGYGAMQELGPFRVNSDGKTLHRNIFSWNKGIYTKMKIPHFGSYYNIK